MVKASHALLLVACLLISACRSASPAAQPNRIAVVGTDGDVYTVKADGGDRVQLTKLGGTEDDAKRSIHFWPSWSPDGRWIASVRAGIVDGEAQTIALYAIPASGGEARNIFGPPETQPFFYSWAPDSRSLAIIS